MPLTFAHPAAIVPLTRFGLPLSALVVGSMSPDFLYYLRLAPRGHFGHTLPGLFLFCLPVGLAVLWLFHRWMKGPLLGLLPLQLQRRLAGIAQDDPLGSARGWLLSALAILSGAVTHIVWDAFTHAGGVGVTLISLLDQPVHIGSEISAPAYKIAQHSSTILGIGVLALGLRRWWKRASEADVHPVLPARIRVARSIVLLALSISLAVGYAVWVASESANPVPVFLGRFVVAATSFTFLSSLVYGMAFHSPGRDSRESD